MIHPLSEGTPPGPISRTVVEDPGDHVNLTINGRTVAVNAPTTTNLLWVLRDYLNMTGTHYGCGSQICGACKVLVDGVAVHSCNLKLSSLTSANVITTIEGLGQGGVHPLQQAWIDHQVPQCGFCQPGMIMACAGLLNATPNPTDADIDAGIDNICVCGTYQRIRAAIHQAAT